MISRFELERIVRQTLEKLVDQGLFDIDLSFVDYDATVQKMDEFRSLDGDFVTGMLRAVYQNGEPVFCFDDLGRDQAQFEAILKMSKKGDDNLIFADGGEPAIASPVQIKREGMVTSMDQITAGRWLMIYVDYQASSLVQVIKVPPGGIIFFVREWGKTVGVKEPGWISEGILCPPRLGILPYRDQGRWETACWAELVDGPTGAY